MLDAALPYIDEIRASASFYFGVPAPVPVIAGQIMQESGFKPDARSPAGALGMLQFMPATAKWAGEAGGFGIAAPLDPKWAIKAGVWYDRFLYDRVRIAADGCNKWLFALSGYNGGEGWVRKRQALSPDPGSWKVTGAINPGITASNQAENAAYPHRIVYVHQPNFQTLGQPVCLAAVAPPPAMVVRPTQPEGLMDRLLKWWKS